MTAGVPDTERREPWFDRSLDVDVRVRSLPADLSDDDRVALARADWSPLTARGLPFPHYADAGSRPGEGMDRDGLALPGDQDELVARVAAANRRTVVVLDTPGPVLMPWLDDVAAVLQVWVDGQPVSVTPTRSG